MSSRTSQLNLYDEQTLTKLSKIHASGDNLILPNNTIVDGVKLEDNTEAIRNMNEILQDLTGKLIITNEETYNYDSDEAVAISADQGQPIVNPVDSGLGWYFTNSSGVAPNNKINWYFVGDSSVRTLGGLFSITGRVKVYNNSNLQDLPYFTIYTKPQGDGNDASGWYRSRQNWLFTNAQQASISNGDTILMVHGNDPVDSDNDIPHMVLEKDNSTSVGNQANDEEILLIALSSDSGATLNSVQFALTKFTSSYNGITQQLNLTS